MTDLPGGPSDKAGNNYEALWGVVCFLKICAGKAKAIRIEPPRVDTAEFYLDVENTRQYWQTKRQHLNSSWTLRALADEKVLEFFLRELRAGNSCVFASITDAEELRTLSTAAKNAANYSEFIHKFLSKDRVKSFSTLCGFWKPIENEEAFELLKRIEVKSGTEATLQDEVLYPLASAFLNGSDKGVVRCLKDIYFTSLHKTLTAAEIYAELERAGFSRKAADSSTAKTAIEQITNSYLAGQQSRLIKGALIPRLEAVEAAQRLLDGEESKDLVILGVAGAGKSAFTFQLVEELQRLGANVLAFRLDELQPGATTLSVGSQLGLAQSPAIELAGCTPDQQAVFVLDQLDCLSVVSGRNPGFFDTVAALIREIRGLRKASRLNLVICCRQFDYNHDHRLQTLASKDSDKVEVQLLDRKTVDRVVSDAGGDPALLSPAQRGLLTLPQNLSLFVAGGLAKGERAAFESQKQLFDLFWEAKRREISLVTGHDSTSAFNAAVDLITSHMSTRQELSLRADQLDTVGPQLLASMVSTGFLTQNRNRYAFSHESLFDYCFARRFVSQNQDFVGLLESDDQHLFRRAQLRQLMVYLRDSDSVAYINLARRILASGRVRQHLKILTLELIASFSDSRQEEFEIFLPLIEGELSFRRLQKPNPNWFESRAFDIVWRSKSLFVCLDRSGFLGSLLGDNNTSIQFLVTLYLQWRTDAYAERIAELIETRLDDPDWASRIRSICLWCRDHACRRFFDIVLAAMKRGLLDPPPEETPSSADRFWHHIHGLGSSQPAWYSELIGAWLERVSVLVKGRQHYRLMRCLGYEHIPDDLETSAKLAPEAFLQNIVPRILVLAHMAKVNDTSHFTQDSLWSLRDLDDPNDPSTQIHRACCIAFNALSSSIDKLEPIRRMLAAESLFIANQLLFELLQEYPVDQADYVLSFLVDNPDRISAGKWLARALIQRFSPHCDASIFRRLENELITFSTPFERSTEGWKCRGDAAATLVSALDQPRRSVSTNARLEELARNGHVPELRPHRARSWTRTSPIPSASLAKMNDADWLRAIAKYNNPESRDLANPGKGDAWELGAELGQIAKSQPARFARLALQFSMDTHSTYFSQVLRAVTESSITDEEKIHLIRWSLTCHPKESLSDALDLVATFSEVPEDLYQNVIIEAANHALSPTSQPDNRDPDKIWIDARNSVRGHAAHTIANLVNRNPKHYSRLADVVSKLANDQSVEMCAAAIEIAHAYFRHDPEEADRLFKIAIERDLRLYAISPAERFLRWSLNEKRDVSLHITRALDAPNDIVNVVGGRLSAIHVFYFGQRSEFVSIASAKNAAVRRGAAQIAGGNFMIKEFREWAFAALRQCFYDCDADVRKESARMFRALHKDTTTPLEQYTDIIKDFITSPAFIDEPTFLFYVLSETRSKIPDCVLDACEAFAEKCAPLARDIQTGHAADEHTVTETVFRLYSQSNDQKIRLRSLGLIDRFSLEGFHTVGSSLAQFDR